MRLSIAGGALALIVFSGAAVLSAQTIIQPGQLAEVSRPAVLLPGVNEPANYSIGVPKTTVADPETRHDKMMNRLWIGSMVAAVAGTSMDAATSWGKHEGNPLLASSDGTFGAKGLSIKAAIAAAVIIPQLCLRRHKELKPVFTFGNFGEAAIFTGVSIHNLQVR